MIACIPEMEESYENPLKNLQYLDRFLTTYLDRQLMRSKNKTCFLKQIAIRQNLQFLKDQISACLDEKHLMVF